MTLTKIAIITSAHGVRGQVKIRSLTGNPQDIMGFSPLTDALGKREFKLTRHGIQKDSLIVAISGITDRNAAKLLKGTELYAPSSALPETLRLIGLEARLENGTIYGRVMAVVNFGAGDIIDIKQINGSSEMLPLCDSFVDKTHANEGYLIIFPPEYVEEKE